VGRFLRLALVLLVLVPGASFARAGDANVPACASGIDSYVLAGSNVQGNPLTDPLLTCYYEPAPNTRGPSYDVHAAWVTAKASPDTHPWFGCGKQPTDPKTIWVSKSYEAYAGINSASAPPGFAAAAQELLRAVEAGFARACGNTVAEPEGSEAADSTPPTVHAITSYGQRSAGIKLAFTVEDDSGRAKVEYGVLTSDRKHLLAHGWSSGFVRATGNDRWWFKWRPRGIRAGTYEFCVIAHDEAGNRSKPSCATLDVRA
jgi:hypothetical protein